MNEKQLRYIITISHAGSVQNASRLLGRDSSTLTRNLKKMEEELGVPLFKRTPSGITATTEGDVVIKAAEKILECCDELKEEGRDHSLSCNEIRYMLAIQECKTISGAAKELFISQPSLSQMLLQTEQDFGRQIFHRKNDGLEETEFGSRFLGILSEIDHIYKRLLTDLEEFQQMRRGKITFGIPLNLGTYLLPRILPAFSEEYPDIQVSFKENNSTELDRLLLSGKTDFGIMHFQEANEALRYEDFFEDPFYLVIPEGMKDKLGFKEQKPLTIRDLQQLKEVPFIMVASRQKLRQVADRILLKAQITPKIRYTTKSMETAKRLAAAGMGVTFLPGSYLDLFSGMEGIACYCLEESLEASWKLVVAYPKKDKLSKSVREFLRILKEHLTNEI
ncbi:MAG: LysR family transcriptional regulator [Clostridiaceae bacterium]|nr:LysR family transcriptional regulator [Clostridiaceae bacterium]